MAGIQSNVSVNHNDNVIVNEDAIVRVNVKGMIGRGCAWTSEEDALLVDRVTRVGARNWPSISRTIPGRTGKSCRLRWLNHLSPNVSHAPFTLREDRIITKSHLLIGNKWATIAKMLKGRTDNGVKNRWNYTLKKRLTAEQLQQHYPPTSGPSTVLTLALPYYKNAVA